MDQVLFVLDISKKWCEKMMPIAQELGLQGEKRRMRYNSTKCHNLINYLICDYFDTSGIKLSLDPHQGRESIPEISSFKEYFEAYLGLLEDTHTHLHKCANLFVGAGARHYAKPLYVKCAEMIDDIKYVRRTLAEGETAKWDPNFIFLYQTTGENIHDEFESKEKKVDSYQ